MCLRASKAILAAQRRASANARLTTKGLYICASSKFNIGRARIVPNRLQAPWFHRLNDYAKGVNVVLGDA
jgi:hypothetical protein